mmetsp:Transcript_15664/g.34354  ORF Transcript_15664/g.34354 Transcript_15664/m.34354 type:complete len:282 (+) Transcript_15664:108-953(+)
MEARARSGSRSPAAGSSSKEADAKPEAEADAEAEAKIKAEVVDEFPECIICSEELSSETDIVKLPCKCTSAYCHGCWDRCLAASVSAHGQALCPSCRCSMRVDYDPVQGRLLFERSSSGTGSDGPEMAADNWRSGLYEKARPRQIMLLQLFGAQAELARAGPDEGSSSVAEDVLQQPEEPRCVCGSRLMRVSVRERIHALVAEHSESAPPSLIEIYVRYPPIICDICDQRMQGSHVWSCENRGRTILHADAYDVCEACFAHHTTGNDVEVVSRAELTMHDN